MCLTKFLALALLAATMATAQESKSTNPAPDELPNLAMGFSIHAMDTGVKPCNNFYQYACGTWMKENEIPADNLASR